MNPHMPVSLSSTLSQREKVHPHLNPLPVGEDANVKNTDQSRNARANFTLVRNAAGRLVYTGGNEVHEGVVPVRAFPIAAPDECISLMNPDGQEIAWIERSNELPEDIRELILEELVSREFTPRISRIFDVSSFATPSTWKVETDRGKTELLLKAEDHIRRLPLNALLITDGHGVTFLICDVEKLDAHSRRLLDRFL